MVAKPSIAEIMREQRKSLSMSLRQLSGMSGVSVAHLGRIEQGLRRPSVWTLQKIAKPLGFDLDELLVVAGLLSPEGASFSEEERDKLRAELKMLSERVASDVRRITEIMNRLLVS